MKQETDKYSKIKVERHVFEADRPISRARAKQEVKNNDDQFKRVLRSSTQVETKGQNNDTTEVFQPLSIGVKNRYCNVCKLTFNTKKTYLIHEKQAHNTNITPIIDLETLYCNICYEKQLRIGMYRHHMFTLHDTFIPDPQKTIPDSPSSDATSPSDYNPRLYCVECNRKYDTRRAYRKHIFQSHEKPRRDYWVATATDTTITPTIDNNSNYCDVCERSFSGKFRYREHLKKVHVINLPPLPNDTSNFDFEGKGCKVCDSKFQTKSAFKRHLLLVHELTLDPPNNAQPDLIPDINHSNKHCVTCGKTFSKRTAFVRHLILKHIEQLPQLYQGQDPSEWDNKKRGGKPKNICKYCDQTFFTAALYRIHLVRVHDIRPVDPTIDIKDPNHHCAPCNRTYRGKLEYRAHLKDLHSMDLPPLPKGGHPTSSLTPMVDYINYYCNTCDRKYSNIFYSTHLLRSHGIKSRFPSTSVNRKEKPIIDQANNYCTACEKYYKNKGGYRAHLRSVHEISLPKYCHKPLRVNPDITPDMNNIDNYCAACDRTYANGGAFRRHLATIHNMIAPEIKQEDV
ncbi:hypothetical protein EDC94DRAFT_646479 [Helicostylum pulchrum]|nr:hypothetical protein EDC94DRAFT_646479 [Helicostylum pulchrum]